MRLLICTFGVLLFAQQALAFTEDQNRATGNRSETFQVERDGRLDLNTRAGDITISTWNKSEAVVTVQGIPSRSAHDLRIRYEGGILRVDYDPRSSRYTINRRNGLRFKIDLPAAFDLDLRTGGGDIEVVGDLTGDVRSHTSGGDVTLRDIGGEVELSTSGGDIRVGTVGGDVHLQTSGGDIRVKKASADLDVQTSGGDIRIGQVGNTLEAQTSGGDITIEYVGGKARITTSGGDIEIGELSGNARITTAGGDIELRNAKGELQVKTAGGELELLNVTGSIDARTAGGDVLAEIIPEGTKDSSLISAGGDIVLYVDPKAKATIEARIHVETWFGFGRGAEVIGPGGDPQAVFSPRFETIELDQPVTEIDEEKLKEIIEKITKNIEVAVSRSMDRAEMSAEELQRMLKEAQRELQAAQRELQAAQRESLNKRIKSFIETPDIPAPNTADDSSLRYKIRSDFEAERKHVNGKKGEISATYRLNGGGNRIWLETSEGNIEIRELNN
ncbi:MAG: DUF4097 family beta strand repeat-containing protein [Gemmatimonadetes bacterium]|nr:DUF4097 family beta strand repeat-containing protein [Gemmatimonadota bacterium]